MKKTTLSILTTLCMLFGILPSCVLAAALPTEWTKPTNVIITNESEENGEFVLQLSYTVGEDHSTFIDDTEYQGNYEKYGLTDAVHPVSQMQIDWRIDGGAWHYDPIWDVANEDREGADEYLYYRATAPYGNERAGSAYFLRLPAKEQWDANDSGWQNAMQAQGVNDIFANDAGYMQLDLTKHKVEARVRLITSVSGADIDTAVGEQNSSIYIISPWSDIAVFGAGAAAVTRPTTLPVPSVTNFAVGKAKDSGTLPDGYPIFTYNLSVPADVEKLASTATALWAQFDADVQVKIGNGEWQNILNDGGWDSVEITSGQHTGYMPGLNENGYTEVLGGQCQMRVRYCWSGDEGAEIYSDWCTPLSFNSSAWQSSDWAATEVKDASELGLIPDSLKNADLTKPITRAEFAAVSVKAYEAMANTQALPAINNPFNDTTDVEVLKAYNVGITAGVSADKFEPNTLLNREQAATMLTRVFKRATLTGWTIQTDSQFTLPYTMPAVFADDAQISGWARDSVYFMVSNDIIKGMGNNNFAPQNITTEQQSTGYANATREQALIIAVRMVKNLK